MFRFKKRENASNQLRPKAYDVIVLPNDDSINITVIKPFASQKEALDQYAGFPDVPLNRLKTDHERFSENSSYPTNISELSAEITDSYLEGGDDKPKRHEEALMSILLR